MYIDILFLYLSIYLCIYTHIYIHISIYIYILCYFVASVLSFLVLSRVPPEPPSRGFSDNLARKWLDAFDIFY